MTLSTAMILQLAMQCAPNVAPPTVAAIVATESQGEPHALNVNGGPRVGSVPTAARAAAIARRYVTAGYSVDLGLGQINSRNMRWLGLTWETVFDPCANIAALGRVLSMNYRVVADGRHPQTALRLALSMYNTGSASRGFRNGYVAKVVGNAGATDATAFGPRDVSQPAVQSADARIRIASETEGSSADALIVAPPPAWNVFEHAAYTRTALAQSAKQQGTILWTR